MTPPRRAVRRSASSTYPRVGDSSPARPAPVSRTYVRTHHGRCRRLYHLAPRPHGVAVSTSPFHGGSGSSILPGGISGDAAGEPAVHQQARTRDVGGGCGAEERGGRGDLLGRPEAAGGDRVARGGLGLLERAVADHTVGGDPAGVEEVEGDAVGRVP